MLIVNIITVNVLLAIHLLDESDYSTTQNALEFQAGPGSQQVRRMCITIQITDDHLPEEDESFIVSLQQQGFQQSDVKILPNRTIIVIQDNGASC